MRGLSLPMMVAGALLAGCYDPSVDSNCRVACQPGGTACPDGLACGADSLCHAGQLDCSQQQHDGGDAAAGPCRAALAAATVTDLANVTGTDYIASSDRTIALFRDDSGNIVEQTDVDTGAGTLTSRTDRSPRLFPDTTLAGALAYATTAAGQLTLVQRNTDEAWVVVTAVTLGSSTMLSSAEQISNPSATAPRHLMLLDGQSLREWIGVTSTSNDTYAAASNGAYGPGDLGVAWMADVALTPDGLGLVFVGSMTGDSTGSDFAIYHATRSSIDDRFSAAVSVHTESSASRVYTPYLDDSCHLYWSDVAHVLHRLN